MNAEIINKKEISKYIDWLESEIDKCLKCDLPYEHLENELRHYNKLIIIGAANRDCPNSSIPVQTV